MSMQHGDQLSGFSKRFALVGPALSCSRNICYDAAKNRSRPRCSSGKVVSHEFLIVLGVDLVSFGMLSTTGFATTTSELAIPLIAIQSSLGLLSVGAEAQSIRLFAIM
jgi:hypothetical protein